MKIVVAILIGYIISLHSITPSQFYNLATDGKLDTLKSIPLSQLESLLQEKGEQALHSAAHRGKLEIVRFLLHKNVSPHTIVNNRSIVTTLLCGHDEREGKDNLPVLKELKRRAVIMLSSEERKIIRFNPERFKTIKEYLQLFD